MVLKTASMFQVVNIKKIYWIPSYTSKRAKGNPIQHEMDIMRTRNIKFLAIVDACFE